MKKFNVKLAVAMIESTTEFKLKQITYAVDSTKKGIIIYSLNRNEFGAFKLIAALESVNFCAYAQYNVELNKVVIHIY